MCKHNEFNILILLTEISNDLVEMTISFVCDIYQRVIDVRICGLS